MSETNDIRGEAPKSPYTGLPGWETEAEQGVLIAIASIYDDWSLPKLIVEIGSENGMSASLFATFAKPADIVCIEINKEANFWHNLQVVKLDKQVIPLYGNSAELDWEAESERLEVKEEIDLLFIDGDHSYNGALADLRNFAPYVEKGGYMLLHDCACATNKHPHPQHLDVTKALEQFMKEAGESLGFRFLFSVDSLTVFRRFHD